MPKKVDANQGEIVDALRKVGAWVYSTAALGDGFPDLIIYFHGRLRLMEIKNGKLVPSKRRLTPAEKKFHDSCPFPILLAESSEDALRLIGAIR